EDFHVGETPDHGLCERQLEIFGYSLSQRGIGIAGNELNGSVFARHPEILTPATRRRGHIKAGKAPQYGAKRLSEAFRNRMNSTLVAGRRKCQRLMPRLRPCRGRTAARQLRRLGI